MPNDTTSGICTKQLVSNPIEQSCSIVIAFRHVSPLIINPTGIPPPNPVYRVIGLVVGKAIPKVIVHAFTVSGWPMPTTPVGNIIDVT